MYLVFFTLLDSLTLTFLVQAVKFRKIRQIYFSILLNVNMYKLVNIWPFSVHSVCWYCSEAIPMIRKTIRFATTVDETDEMVGCYSWRWSDDSKQGDSGEVRTRMKRMTEILDAEQGWRSYWPFRDD